MCTAQYPKLLLLETEPLRKTRTAQLIAIITQMLLHSISAIKSGNIIFFFFLQNPTPTQNPPYWKHLNQTSVGYIVP